MKTKILLFSLIFFVFNSFSAYCQEDEFNQFKKQTESEFSDFASKNQKIFDDFVTKNDKEFADFLRKAWKDFEGKDPEKPKLGGKPEKKPIVKPKEIRKTAENVEERVIVVQKTPQVIPFALGSSLPPIQKKEAELKKKASVSLLFYGLQKEFQFDPKLKETMGSGDISPDLIANFWEAASKCNHYDLVNDLMEFKKDHKLNDWAYYQLIGKLTTQMTDNKNHAKLMKWFLLIKSRYNTKIGYNTNNVYLMVASEYMIFGKNYFAFDNVNYFILDNDNVKSLRSYEGNYPDAKTKLSFLFNESPILGNDVKSRSLKFNYLAGKYDINLNYNTSNVEFYNSIPQLDLPLYFNSSSSGEFIQSMAKNLKPLLEGLDELSAVSFLLKFAQTSFDYKTDPQQFGYEKFFFAEETVFYPFSDCEDRSVFFATLVQELLGMQVVGLEYPGHVATAVRFSENRNGDHLFYNGDKYIICDPTFINAPVGMCMPQFLNIEAKVIPLNSKLLGDLYQEQIKSKIIAAGGNANDVQIEIDENGNAYVVSTYDKTLTFETTTFQAGSKPTNAFLAKFDKNKKLVWANNFSGDDKLRGEYVKTSSDGSTYVGGMIGNTAEFGKQSIVTSSKDQKIFLAKYDKNGKFEWLKTANIPSGANENFIVVSRFTSIGKEVSTMIFEKNKGFDAYGLSFSTSGDIVITMQITK